MSGGVVFLAELGDKSQLIALTFAARYRRVHVLLGIAVATVVLSGLSVGIGATIGAAIPERAVAFAAGLAFIAYGLWTLRLDEAPDERVDDAHPARQAVLAVAAAFFIAELGDKTMLTTATLAATRNAAAVWLGSTLGLVAANSLAVAAGAGLRARLGSRMNLVTGVAFLVFGAALLIGAW